MSPRQFTGAALAAGLLWAPQVAMACPVCFSTKSKEQEVAYLATTGFLTLLPLIGMAAIGWWLRRRMRELAEPQLPTVRTTAQAPAGGDLHVVTSRQRD